jgi:DNA mismatch repair protein MutS
MYPEVKNYSVSVYETDKEVLFMKKIVKGWASKSYWIDVAKIAWIPDEILKLSREILKWFESKQSESNSHTQIISTPLFEIQNNDSKYQEKYEKIQRIITQADLNNMTPIQAIQFLAKIKDELENDQ